MKSSIEGSKAAFAMHQKNQIGAYDGSAHARESNGAIPDSYFSGISRNKALAGAAIVVLVAALLAAGCSGSTCNKPGYTCRVVYR